MHSRRRLQSNVLEVETLELLIFVNVLQVENKYPVLQWSGTTRSNNYRGVESNK